MKIFKIIMGITFFLLVIGMVSATDNVDLFKAPSSLQPLGDSSFIDRQGHNIQIMEDEKFHETWFENNTDYLVEPYENNSTFYLYVDSSDVDPDGIEEIGILEIVEKDGTKYIISSWTPNDGDEDAKLIFSNLLEFNKLNNLKPLEI